MPPSSFTTPEWPAIADIENVGFTPEDLITWLEGLSAKYMAALDENLAHWGSSGRPEAADRMRAAQARHDMRQKAMSLAIGFLKTLDDDGSMPLSLGNPTSREECKQRFFVSHAQAGAAQSSPDAAMLKDGWHAVTLAWSGCAATEIMTGLPPEEADAMRAACAEKIERLVPRADKQAIEKYWQRETEANIQDLLRRGTAELT